jgi:dipeptidyl aminopeptidase/acylaminoacyl peptidase
MTRCTALASCLLATLSIAASDGEESSGKRAFEIADYYRTAFPGAPAINPEGNRLVVSVRRFDLERGESWSEIWIMDGHGSRPRRMTFGATHDTDPVFSPDGKHVLFVSDRTDGERQLYLIPVDGGEARQLTDFPLDLSDPVWSPDGKWIAVTAQVYPECGADADCNGTIHRAREEGPLKAYMTDELLYRHWDQWRENRYRHVLLVDSGTGAVVRDVTPGLWDSPTFSLGGDIGYAFSPDSAELCFVSNRDSVPAMSTNSDLWLVPIIEGKAEGRPVNITAANRGWDGDPHYSPDGRWIAFRSQAEAGYESDLFRIAIYDREHESVRYLTDRAGFDNWATALAWTPDSTGLVFQAEETGTTPLYRIPLAGGDPESIVADGALVGWSLTPDGTALVYTRSTVGEPPEVHRVPMAGGEVVRLSDFNRGLATEVDIRPAEQLWVPGAGDYELQVFLVTPHGFDPTRKYPLILNVHGGPQMPWRDRYRGDWQVYPGKGYLVAFANPTGSAGFGQQFVDDIACDFGGRVYDDLMKVTDALQAIPYVDGDRMGAMGWSYGGYMMMWFAGHTGRFAALAAMMGVYDLRSMYGATEELWWIEHDLCGRPWTSEHYRKWSPSNHAEAFSTPTLVITGERDYRVPYTQSLQFFTDLQVRQVPSRLIVFPDGGHWPSWYEMSFYYLAHLDWFHQWLGGDSPPWDLGRFLNNQVFGDGDTLASPDGAAAR